MNESEFSEFANCPMTKRASELSSMREEIAALKREVVKLEGQMRSQANVRVWLKLTMMVFFVFSVVMLSGQYIFTSQVEALGSDIRNLRSETQCLKQ